MIYTMMQVCKEADLTYQALKFYCNEGLIPNVKRDKNNRRIFDEKDLKWIKDLGLLKEVWHEHTGNEIIPGFVFERAVLHPQRKVILAQKQELLRQSIRELEDSVAYIDWKQNFYDEVLSGSVLM